MAYAQIPLINAHADVSSKATGLEFGMSLHLHLHALCMRAANALVRLYICTDSLYFSFKLLKQGYRYHKIRKAFSKFYHRHSELIVKYNIWLKTLL